MATELAKLKHQRTTYKSQVTRIETYLDNNRPTWSEAVIRLKRLEEIFKDFEKNQLLIECQEPEDKNQQRFEPENEEEREFFDERYLTVAAKAQAIIDRSREAHEIRLREAGQHQPPTPGQPMQPVAMEIKATPKLPELKLPEFDGEFTKWMIFKNSFETTIDKNRDVPAVRKFQYLIGLLHGKARKVIESLEITEDNYQAAWKLLLDTYDNKVMLIQNHLEELFNFPMTSKENRADSIRKLIWHVQTHLASLKTLDQPVDQWDTIIIHLARKHLEYVEQNDWQDYIKSRTTDNMPKLDEFIKFLTERCHTLRMLSQSQKSSRQSDQKPEKKGTTKNEKKATKREQKKSEQSSETKVSLAAAAVICKFCEGSHTVNWCEAFKKLSIEERRREILKRDLCANCLSPGHFAEDCWSQKCKKCQERHNTLLHRDRQPAPHQQHQSTSAIVSHAAEATVFCVQRPRARVILSTAQIYIKDAEGRFLVCRALLDPGSQSNLITRDLVKKLKLSTNSENRLISGINQSKTNSSKSTNVHIKSLYTNFSAEIECSILPIITEQIPQTKIDMNKIVIPKSSQLADSVFHEPGTIDLLIGAGLYWKLLVDTPRNRLDGQPAL